MKLIVMGQQAFGKDCLEKLISQKIRDQLRLWEEQGYGKLPICMAKTQYSLHSILSRPIQLYAVLRPAIQCRSGFYRGRLRRNHDDAWVAARAVG